MFFNPFRPRPKFRRGQLTRVPPCSNVFLFRYLLIERRRWDSTREQWVYDGLTFITTRGELIYASETSGIRENDIRGVPGVEYPQKGYDQRWA